MSIQPILRFAPSPNGLLHLGHAFSALFTWRCAAQLGGQALVRIEDIDVARCKPEYDAAILADLNWLGLTWPEPVMRQSQRFAAYGAAIVTLRALDLLYPCFCSRKDIAAVAREVDPDGAPRYPGTCRGMSPADIAHRLERGLVPQWRLRMDAALALAGASRVGEFTGTTAPVFRSANPAPWGDAVIVRKDTPTSYHLAVVVDDAAQGVSHVTRGMDLYHATDLQVLLQALLGLPSPVYCHHELVRDGGDGKLSKSKGAPSLAGLREGGVTADMVRAELGF